MWKQWQTAAQSQLELTEGIPLTLWIYSMVFALCTLGYIVNWDREKNAFTVLATRCNATICRENDVMETWLQRQLRIEACWLVFILSMSTLQQVKWIGNQNGRMQWQLEFNGNWNAMAIQIQKLRQLWCFSNYNALATRASWHVHVNASVTVKPWQQGTLPTKVGNYTATAIPVIYSFSGNSAASAPISTFMCLWAIYIFPGSVYIFPPAEQADPSWEYIIRSQTHECGLWKLGLRPRYSFSGNICFKFSAFCHCSVDTMATLNLGNLSWQLDTRATLSLGNLDAPARGCSRNGGCIGKGPGSKCCVCPAVPSVCTPPLPPPPPPAIWLPKLGNFPPQLQI
jgi:hypothetical protein